MNFAKIPKICLKRHKKTSTKTPRAPLPARGESVILCYMEPKIIANCELYIQLRRAILEGVGTDRGHGRGQDDLGDVAEALEGGGADPRDAV